MAASMKKGAACRGRAPGCSCRGHEILGWGESCHVLLLPKSSRMRCEAICRKPSSPPTPAASGTMACSWWSSELTSRLACASCPCCPPQVGGGALSLLLLHSFVRWSPLNQAACFEFCLCRVGGSCRESRYVGERVVGFIGTRHEGRGRGERDVEIPDMAGRRTVILKA